MKHSSQRHSHWLRTGAASCVALLAGVAACSDDTGHADDESTRQLAAEASRVLDTHLAQREFVGAALALHDPERGDVVVTSGTREPVPGADAVDPDVPWGIGSITKTFVAVVTLQLAEEGALDLDASIEPAFPELPRAADITVRRLLQHTSGLNEYFESPAVNADPRRVWSPSELVDAAVALGPVAEPGAGYHYSNTNYILLGELVAAIDGRSWYDAVRARILEPLGMSHTHYIGRSPAPPLGSGYRIVDGQFVDYTQESDASLGDSAGGLQSTASDLMRFVLALRDGDLLDEQRQAEMRAFIPGEPQGYVGHEYGLGLEKYTAGELTLYGHLGTSAAHAAFIGFEPESGAAAAVLINVAEPVPSPFMAFEALGAIVGKDISPPAANVAE